MLPWAIISACSGDIKLALGVFILWMIMSIVRQFLEPKLVSSNLGVHPIFTLIAMYTGFRVAGIVGLFLGPILLIILKNIFAEIIDQGVMKSFFSREYE